MKTRRNSLVIILNAIVSILFLLPAIKLDLFNENYSTLSLTTRGYLYVLFLGIVIGSLLGYETYTITRKKVNGILMFLSLIIGTIIPHHVPYNLQGNLHLLFAYIGFASLAILTLLNCKNSKYFSIYSLLLFVSIALYLKYGMVNTLSEIIVMISSLYINLVIYFKNIKKGY